MDSLEELLPQARPMILLSGIAASCDDGRTEAYVDVSPSSPFYDAEAEGVPGCVALEYMAQTMALAVGLARRRRGLSPRQIGYVLGSRRLTVRLPHFRNGVRYGVTAVCTYSDESFGSFACAIADPTGTIVAEGEVTAYRPPEGRPPDADGNGGGDVLG